MVHPLSSSLAARLLPKDGCKTSKIMHKVRIYLQRGKLMKRSIDQHMMPIPPVRLWLAAESARSLEAGVYLILSQKRAEVPGNFRGQPPGVWGRELKDTAPFASLK